MDSMLLWLSRVNRRKPAKVLISLLVTALLVTSYHPIVATNAATETTLFTEPEAIDYTDIGSDFDDATIGYFEEIAGPQTEESNNSSASGAISDNGTIETAGDDADPRGAADPGYPEHYPGLEVTANPDWAGYSYGVADAAAQGNTNQYTNAADAFGAMGYQSTAPDNAKAAADLTGTAAADSTKDNPDSGVSGSEAYPQKEEDIVNSPQADNSPPLEDPANPEAVAVINEDEPAPEEAAMLMMAEFAMLAANSYSLIFLSEGTQVTTRIYEIGQNTVAPANPTRTGYNFKEWVVFETNQPFKFGSPLTQDTILQATWTAAQAGFAVVYWLERPNLGRSATPGVFSDYAYAFTEFRNGISETTTAITTMSQAAKNSSLAMTHSTVQSVANTVVNGNGTGVVNVFCARNVFEIRFDLQGGVHRTSMRFNGREYSGSSALYTIRVKFGQNIGDIWPCHATALFTTANPNVAFSGWRHNEAARSEITSWATIREEFTADMLPRNSNATGYTLYADWRGPLIEKRVNYWLEALPSEAGTSGAKQVNGKWYVVSPRHSLTYSSAGRLVAPKDILGTTLIDNISTNNLTATPITFDFFYQRNVYTLRFNTMSGSNIAPQKVMFGDRLANKRPTNPTRTGNGFTYTFKGWFTDAGYSQEFNFNQATMPAGDLELFAKWEAAQFTVSYYNKIGDTRPFHTQAVALNGVIQSPYKQGERVSGLGAFKNWQWQVGSKYVEFNPNKPINSDLQLYAEWQPEGGIISDTYRVTYNRGQGTTGTVPTDSNLYRSGDTARILAGQNLTINNRELFHGWQIRGEDPIYYPGNTITVNRNIELVAIYRAPEEPKDVFVQVNYVANYPGGKTHTVQCKLADAKVMLLSAAQARAQGIDRPGYSLTRWTLVPVQSANTRTFNPGTTYTYDQLQLDQKLLQITLYAQWEAIVAAYHTISYHPGPWATWTPVYTGPRPNVVHVRRGETYTIPGQTEIGVYMPWMVFSHWSTSPDNGWTTEPRYYPGTKIVITGDMVLYATWYSAG